MSYKPLTDEELDVFLNIRPPANDERMQLFEQARRANRLAEATAAVIRFYESEGVSMKRELELLRAEKEALAAYRGDT